MKNELAPLRKVPSWESYCRTTVLDVFDQLEICVHLLKMQIERPYVLINTGSYHGPLSGPLGA